MFLFIVSHLVLFYYLIRLLILCFVCHLVYFFFFKQKTAYEMRISDWSSDVCSSDLYTANTTTNSDTPPYVRSAQTSTIDSIARCAPTMRMVAATIALEKPEISISLPNTAPSRNTGKYSFRK